MSSQVVCTFLRLPVIIAVDLPPGLYYHPTSAVSVAYVYMICIYIYTYKFTNTHKDKFIRKHARAPVVIGDGDEFQITDDESGFELFVGGEYKHDVCCFGFGSVMTLNEYKYWQQNNDLEEYSIVSNNSSSNKSNLISEISKIINGAESVVSSEW